MGNTKYRGEITDKGICLIVEADTGHIVAKAREVTSMEWLVEELNTLTWALGSTLKKLDEKEEG